MRKRLLIILLFIATSFNLYSQVDTTFHAIKENTEKTAQHTEKGGYEYLTLAVSLLAFLTAGITLYYTIKTFQSQKKTEFNTRKWSNKQERSSLREVEHRLSIAYAHLLTIEKHSIKSKLIPSEGVMQKLKIDVNLLHTNEAFEGEDITSLLEKCRLLCVEYNNFIDNRISELKKGKFNTDIGQNRAYNVEKGYFDNEYCVLISLFEGICQLHNSMWSLKEKKQAENCIKYLSKEERTNAFEYTWAVSIYSNPKIDQFTDLDYSLVFKDYSLKKSDAVKEWMANKDPIDFGHTKCEKGLFVNCRISPLNNPYSDILNSDGYIFVESLRDYLLTILYDVYSENLYDQEIDFHKGIFADLRDYFTMENGITLYIEADSAEEFDYCIVGGFSNDRERSLADYLTRSLAQIYEIRWEYAMAIKEYFLTRFREESIPSLASPVVNKVYSKLQEESLSYNPYSDSPINIRSLVLKCITENFQYEAKMKVNTFCSVANNVEDIASVNYKDIELKFNIIELISLDKYPIHLK